MLLTLRRPLALALAAGLGVALLACGKPRAAREDQTLKNLEQDNGYVAQFRTQYPKSVVFFTNFQDGLAPTIWRARQGLAGRYVLEMRIELVMNEDRSRAVSAKPPRFMLREVERAERVPEGGVNVKFRSASQLDFGASEWLQFLEKNGDLSALGVQPGPPIPDFDKLWPDF